MAIVQRTALGLGLPLTRIENRLGEPLANPYLYVATQIHAGLDGLRRRLHSRTTIKRQAWQRREYFARY